MSAQVEHHHTLNNHPADETPFSPTPVKGDQGNKNRIGMQVVWAGITGGLDGTVMLEQSIDGTTWTTKGVTGTVTLNSAAGDDLITINAFHGRLLRVVYTHGTITGGTVNVHIHTKQ